MAQLFAEASELQRELSEMRQGAGPGHRRSQEMSPTQRRLASLAADSPHYTRPAHTLRLAKRARHDQKATAELDTCLMESLYVGSFCPPGAGARVLDQLAQAS